jgi:hypothetical protein
MLIGRWRIVEAGLWDRDHIHLVRPAFITVQADGTAKLPSALSSRPRYGI